MMRMLARLVLGLFVLKAVVASPRFARQLELDSYESSNYDEGPENLNGENVYEYGNQLTIDEPQIEIGTLAPPDYSIPASMEEEEDLSQKPQLIPQGSGGSGLLMGPNTQGEEELRLSPIDILHISGDSDCSTGSRDFDGSGSLVVSCSGKHLGSGGSGGSGDIGSEVSGDSGDFVSGDSGASVDLVSGDSGNSGDLVSGDSGESGDLVSGDSGDSGDLVSGDFGVSGDLVSGDPGISGDLVSGDSGISGEIVPGESGVSGDFVSGDSGVSGDFVSGDSGISGDFGVSGDLISGESGVSGDLISGDSEVSGDIVSGDLVSGDSVDSGDLVSGESGVSGDLVSGESGVSGDHVSGDDEISGPILLFGEEELPLIPTITPQEASGSPGESGVSGDSGIQESEDFGPTVPGVTIIPDTEKEDELFLPTTEIPPESGGKVDSGPSGYPEVDLDIKGMPTCLLCTCLGSSVYCDDVKLTTVPPLPKETTHFYARYNQITMINKGDFAQMNKLKRIDLTANAIKLIADDAFSGLPALEELVLRENSLAHLPAMPTTMTLIDGSHNNIGATGIHKEAFKDMTGLLYLYLTDNHINHIPVPLPDSLRSLHLQRNNIQMMHEDTFCNLKDFNYIRNSLEDIRLDGNPINLSNTPQAYICLPRVPIGALI
ncbi:epiphycan isoform X1 [Esox lucius]|uniref:LRRNT domain-containing protein n=1 Tax=Esox lucius TaxID=8010 RepID=A0A3P8ZCB9_ESOLU|nr:epiphycan isoform X1 [Esox lucius]